MKGRMNTPERIQNRINGLTRFLHMLKGSELDYTRRLIEALERAMRENDEAPETLRRRDYRPADTR